MVGACGGIGSTVALGLSALRAKTASRTGLVTELPGFAVAGLVDPADLVVGGHEVRSESILDAVLANHRGSNLFDAELIRRSRRDLESTQKNIAVGTLFGSGPTVRKIADRQAADRDRSAAEAIERLSDDLLNFRREHALDGVVVVHVASSEPPFELGRRHQRYAALCKSLAARTKTVLPTSSLYALAALEAGCAFINFTPSLGISVPAIQERADELGLPYMGNDGKTGETLVKSALAPMFAMRHLNILSWVGQNILGNRDGAVLDDPKTRASKIRTKDRIIGQILGRSPTTRVSIDYIPSLEDWKIAWDFIHFEGFLGTKMNMQFTWCGSDSVLAAPLIIDLARLAVHEMDRGGTGPMTHLGFFFKDPIDVHEHDLFTQWANLVSHVTGEAEHDGPGWSEG